jgi:hypothetical protein
MGPVPCTEAKRFFAAVVGVQLAIWAVRRSAARCGLCHERNEHPLLSYVVAIAFLLIISDALYRRIGCATSKLRAQLGPAPSARQQLCTT